MKLKVLAFVVLAGALAAAASVQNETNQEKSKSQEKGKSKDKNDPLSFIKVAADVAGNVQRETVNKSLGLYVAEGNWASGLNDGDLGPFLKLKEAKPGRSAACLFTQAKDSAVCVYFDGQSPFGIVAVKAGANGGIQPQAISAAYKAISKEMLKHTAELTFTPTTLATDEGQELPAFLVTRAAEPGK
jgi:hypothetical protein